MNRLDLIIDALEKIINACKLYDHQDIQDGGTVYLEEELEASIKALAAARELKALKPVGYMDSKGVLFNNTTHPHLNTPLFALDEVKHD